MLVVYRTNNPLYPFRHATTFFSGFHHRLRVVFLGTRSVHIPPEPHQTYSLLIKSKVYSKAQPSSPFPKAPRDVLQFIPSITAAVLRLDPLRPRESIHLRFQTTARCSTISTTHHGGHRTMHRTPTCPAIQTQFHLIPPGHCHAGHSLTGP